MLRQPHLALDGTVILDIYSIETPSLLAGLPDLLKRFRPPSKNAGISTGPSTSNYLAQRNNGQPQDYKDKKTFSNRLLCCPLIKDA